MGLRFLPRYLRGDQGILSRPPQRQPGRPLSACLLSSNETWGPGDPQHRLCGVDDKPGSKQADGEEAADAMDSSWSPLATSGAYSGSERGLGRRFPQTVSGFSTRDSGCSATTDGCVTPDFLALSKIGGVSSLFRHFLRVQ